MLITKIFEGVTWLFYLFGAFFCIGINFLLLVDQVIDALLEVFRESFVVEGNLNAQGVECLFDRLVPSIHHGFLPGLNLYILLALVAPPAAESVHQVFGVGTHLPFGAFKEHLCVVGTFPNPQLLGSIHRTGHQGQADEEESHRFDMIFNRILKCPNKLKTLIFIVQF